MPSRRTFLAAAGATALGAVAGCIGGEETTSGVVWNKRVIVEVPAANGGWVGTDLANVVFDVGERHLHASYDPEYVSLDGQRLAVSSSHDRLSDDFENVRYHVGVDTDDGSAVNAAADRVDFDRVTAGGHTTVSTYWAENGRGYVDVRDAGPREAEPETVDTHTFDIREFGE